MKRGYSQQFTPKSDKHGRYLLDRIPAQLWRQAKAKSKREGVSIRAVLLQALTDWLIVPVAPIPPHYWTSGDDKNICRVCGDGPFGRHRFQVQPDKSHNWPVPPTEALAARPVPPTAKCCETECCDALIDGECRYCPKCGWECRIKASPRTWTGFHPKRIQELGLLVDRNDFYVRDAKTREVRLMTDDEWNAAMAVPPTSEGEK